MCLIVFALEKHPQYKLILAANRDEFYERPTEQANLRGNVICGIDLKAGGTWLGVNPQGRFAALTNFRDLRNLKKDAPSRGALVADFLKGSLSPSEYFDNLAADPTVYNGYNIVALDGDQMAWFSNITGQYQILSPGIYGLSNAFLNTRWRKNLSAEKRLEEIIKKDTVNTENLLSMMRDEEQAPDKELPDTGVGFALEKVLSSIFINTKGYGTRCTTIVLIDYEGRVEFTEVSYNEKAEITGVYKYDWH